MLCFLVERRKIISLGRKNIPPLLVLNGPPLRKLNKWQLRGSGETDCSYLVVDFAEKMSEIVAA